MGEVSGEAGCNNASSSEEREEKSKEKEGKGGAGYPLKVAGSIFFYLCIFTFHDLG